MKVGDFRNGFQVVSVEKLRDVDATLWRMSFVQNGADLIWLERKDEVKTFLIGFKTLPKDDTGVAHILEHSVLCGSEKYPVKSPFNEMRKSSPCSFMNAMTARDLTYYPFSSRYDGDFLNLLDVYLDAVFYPLVIKDPKIFQQEGWHYEYNSTDGTLFCNGVVLNEMKGVFAEPERRASREVLRWLYPDVVYGNDSGGTPEAIPTLSFQDFCQFYKTYYHPSNSFIFLDGDIKLDEVLTRLENVLKNYSHRGNRFEIPIQSPIECKKSFNYNASNSSATTFLVEGWSVGTFKDYVDFLALDLIAKYLCETNEAPLKKLLLEKGVCDDVAFWGDQFQQNSFCFLFRNLHSETALVDELILGFLRKLVEEGFDKSRLTALIDNYEFSIRENNNSRPLGLVNFSRLRHQWIYGGNPASSFDFTNFISVLRNGVENNYFQRCIKQYLLDNHHHVELIYSPANSIGEGNTDGPVSPAKKPHGSLSSNEVEEIIHKTQILKEYQREKDKAENLAKIPVFHVNNIPIEKQGIVFDTQKSEHQLNYCIATPRPGIAYLTILFPIDHIPAHLLSAIPLFTKLLGDLGTIKHSPLELQDKIKSTVGSLTFSVQSYPRGNFFRINIALLPDKIQKAIDLLSEIINETSWNESKAIQTILRQKRLKAERAVSLSGVDFALCYSSQGFAKHYAVRDYYEGFHQLRWLQEQDQCGVAEFPMKQLSREIFNQEQLIFAFTDNLPDTMPEQILSILPQKRNLPSLCPEIACQHGNLQGFVIEGDSGFSGWTAPLKSNYHGSMCTAAKILSRGYLHKEIREIGGAYGAAMFVLPTGFIKCYTYRDPSPVQSMEKMRHLGLKLHQFLDTEEDIERYIVSAVVATEPLLSPRQEFAKPIELFLNNRTFEDENRTRRQIITTTRNELYEFAEELSQIESLSQSCVIGNKEQLNTLHSVQSIYVNFAK